MHVLTDKLADLNQRVGVDDIGQLALERLTRREHALIRADAHAKLRAYWREIAAIHHAEFTLAKRADPTLTVGKFLAARRGG
jgi:hypothetical protein